MSENFIRSKNTDIAPVTLKLGDNNAPAPAAAVASRPQSDQPAPSAAASEASAGSGDMSASIQQATSTLQVEIDRLNAELEKMRGVYREQDVMHQRTLADFDNFRRRVNIEKEVTTKLANEKLIKELLTTVDNYARSLEVSVSPEAQDFKLGMEIIYKNFLQILKNNGLELIESDGAKFDPNLHEAVSHVDSGLPAETVVSTYQRGYMLGDRVLRHAIVVVSNGSGTTSSVTDQTNL